MFATRNLPGSQYFTWYHGTKAECEAWLQHLKDTEPYYKWQGGVIITDREAKTWRWRDGSRIFYHWDGERKRSSAELEEVTDAKTPPLEGRG